MGSSTIQIALIALGCGAFGVFVGWSIQAVIGRRRIRQLAGNASKELRDVSAQRDKLANRLSKSRSMIEMLKASNARRSDELATFKKKTKQLARNIVTLRKERENTKIKVTTFQAALSELRRKTTALQSEFDKSRDFYKRELVKSFDKRTALESELKEARFEQEEFARRIESSTLEHGSAEDMVIAAQLRLGQLEVLERNVNKLEAENARLEADARKARQEFEARERDLAELEELRIHNKQLVQCVEALESSRQEHESDAERYREKADQSEKMSETLRLKLDDLATNFANIEKQQQRALSNARKAEVVPMLRKQR